MPSRAAGSEPHRAYSLRTLGLLATIALGGFIGPFGGVMIVPMMRAIREAYGVDLLLVALSITTYMTPFTLLQPLVGLLSDVIHDRRRLMVIGFTTYSLGAVMAATSPSMTLFLASRAVQGVGSALSLPLVMAVVGDAFTADVRGRVMGMLAVAITLGSMLGNITGGLMAVRDWRRAFILSALVSLAAAVGSALTVPGVRGLRPSCRRGVNALKRALLSAPLLLLGLVGFTVFYARVSALTYLSDTLSSEPYSLREDIIGGYLSLSGVGGLLGGPLAGHLTDAVGRRRTALIGLASMTLSLALLLSPAWYALLPLAVLLVGLTSTLSSTPVNTMAVEVEPGFRATAVSVYNSLRFLGYTLAPALAYPAYKSYSLPGVVATGMAMLATATLVLASARALTAREP